MKRTARHCITKGWQVVGGDAGQAPMYYTKHIEQYFGNTVYNNLVEHYLKESSVYDDSVILSEQMMYGSSRLGTVRQQVCVSASRIMIGENLPIPLTGNQTFFISNY